METTQFLWLVIFGLGAALIVFLPRLGLLAAWNRRRKSKERERTEDALKLLLNLKWENRPSSPANLKAGLSLTDSQTLEVIARMTAQGLVVTRGSDLVLTTDGERLALQIIRAHRLMERYLADEARMSLDQIHGEAHRREHQLDEAQIEELDAALGHPARDPHGDPIPTRQGLIRQTETQPLTAIQPNQLGRVIHIEDEPAIAYAQLQAEGIRLGQTIRVVEATPERLVLTDGENEYRLAPVIAANVNVEKVTQLAEHDQRIPLFQLAKQQEGEIVSLDESCQGFTRRRFLDLGLTPGTTISPELPNAFGDPRAYRVRGTLIALRKEQAAQIWVRPL